MEIGLILLKKKSGQDIIFKDFLKKEWSERSKFKITIYQTLSEFINAFTKKTVIPVEGIKIEKESLSACQFGSAVFAPKYAQSSQFFPSAITLASLPLASLSVGVPGKYIDFPSVSVSGGLSLANIATTGYCVNHPYSVCTCYKG